MLIDLCERNGLFITCIQFKHPKRRLYNWTAPGHRILHQLDYIPTLETSIQEQYEGFADHYLILSLSITYCLPKCTLGWIKSWNSNKINQDDIWRSSMVDGRKCKTLWRKNSLKSNLKLRILIRSDTMSRNVFRILWVIWLGNWIGKQENHELHRKLSIKWMNHGKRRM